MRNLKKVMALALATVMLFGMMVMGAGAADYTDAAQIDAKYATPVELLKAMEVFEGSEGALNPKSTLTRAEAAVSVAKLALTKGIASKLGAAATNFADVDDSYAWASGAIAWAENLGIVSGYNGNYDPAGTLTGYQYAKMLLVVLGYDAATEGYTGATWASNVNLDAIQAGLLNNLTIDMGAAILREEAIQMVYNALLADCVWYETAGTSITLPDGTVIAAGGSAAKKVANTKEAGYNAATASNDENMQLIEKLYKNFKLNTATVDANGYATKTWVNATTGKSVVVENNYTVVKAYTDAVEAVKTGTIYADGGYVEKKGVQIYVNDLDTKLLNDKGEPVTTDIKLNGTAKPAVDFAGATLEYVKNGADYVLVVKFPTLTTVSKVNAATASAGATVEFAGVTNKNDKNEDVAVKVETEAYAKDQKVFVTLGKDAAGKTIVLAHKAATVITGAVTETAKDAAYIDGVKYPIAGYANVTVPAVGATKYNVVVENGYIVEIAGIATAPTKPTLSKVYYVGAMSAQVPGVYADDAAYYVAKLVSLADGTVIDQKIVDGEELTGLVTIEDQVVAGTTTKTGYKELKAYTGATDTFAVDTDFDATVAATDKSIAVDAGKSYFTANSVVLTIENLGKSTVKATAKTAPVAGTYADAIVVTSLNKTATADKADEVEIIVVVKEKFTAATVTVTGDLYYVLKGDLGKIYDATAKKTLTKVEAVNIKTFEKETLTVLATLADGGFAELKTDATTGLKKFEAAALDTKYLTVAKGTAVEIYGNLLTVNETVKDADFSAAKFYNATGAKNGTTTVASIAGLLDTAGKTVAETVVKYSVAATTGVVTIDYVVVVG